MTVTYGKPERIGHWTTVFVESDIVGEVWFHWYRDGVLVHSGQANSHTFYVGTGAQAEIVCMDTASPSAPDAPQAWPATRTVFWWPSMSGDIKEYRPEYQKDGGSWTAFGRVRHNPEKWLYQIETERLDDLSTYAFRVVPIDNAGNDGTAQEIESEIVVRTPDAERYSLTFSAGTSRVTFSAV